MKRALMLLAVALLSACASTTQVDKSLAYAQVHTDLAAQYYAVGQVGVAVKEAESALNVAPDYVAAHSLLGLMYAQLRQNEQADAHFTRALAIAPNNTDVRNSYAWYLCGSDRAQEALAEFAQVLRDPLYASMDKALTNAGVCAARIGRFDLARSYLRAALDVTPNNPVAQVYRAHMAVTERNFAAAREDARAAQVLNDAPTLLWLNLRLAQAQNQRGATEQLMADLLRKAPTSDEAAWARAGQYNRF